MTDDQSESKKQRHHYELIGETVRIYRRGDTWYVNFQHEGRQHRQSLHTRSKKEARLRAIRLEARLLDGRFTGQVNAPTITSTIDKYMESLRAEGRARKTLQKYENVFERLGRLAECRRVTKITMRVGELKHLAWDDVDFDRGVILIREKDG